MQVIRWDELFTPDLPIFCLFALFYAFVLVMIVTSKQELLNGSFFIIIVYTGVADLLFFICTELNEAHDRIGLGPDYELFYHITLRGMDILLIVHIVSNFLATVSQFMAVAFLQYFKRVWTVWKTFLYLVVTTILIVIPFWSRFFNKERYAKLEDGSYYIWYTDTGEADNVGYLFSAIVSVFCALVTPLLLVATFICLNKMGASKKIRRHYQGLIMVISLDCIFCWLDVFYELDYIFDNDYDIQILPQPIYDFLIDYSQFYFQLIPVVNPVVLVLFSQTARREVFRWFRRTPKRTTLVRTVTLT